MQTLASHLVAIPHTSGPHPGGRAVNTTRSAHRAMHAQGPSPSPIDTHSPVESARARERRGPPRRRRVQRVTTRHLPERGTNRTHQGHSRGKEAGPRAERREACPARKASTALADDSVFRPHHRRHRRGNVGLGERRPRRKPTPCAHAPWYARGSRWTGGGRNRIRRYGSPSHRR